MHLHFIGVLMDGAIIALAVCLYFLPAIIGSKRGISSDGALFVVNLIFGWTLVGWLICLLWAATGATRAQDDFFRGRMAGAPYPNDPTFQEAYARERARLDHLEGRRTNGVP